MLGVPFAFHSREGGSGRALPTETKVESGTSRSKSGTTVDLSDSGKPTPSLHHFLGHTDVCTGCGRTYVRMCTCIFMCIYRHWRVFINKPNRIHEHKNLYPGTINGLSLLVFRQGWWLIFTCVQSGLIACLCTQQFVVRSTKMSGPIW